MVGEEVRRVPYLLSKGRFTLSSSSSCSSSSYLSLSPGTENCGECGLDGMELEAARALACISRTVVREGGGRGLNRFKNRSQDRDWETSDQGWDLAHDSEDNKAIRAKVEEETKVQQTSETLPPSSNYSTNSLSFSGRKTRLNLSHLTEAEKEARRVRRVVANRESARQTIRRRQAFRDGLAKKVSDLSLVNQNMKIGPIFHDGMKEWSCCKQRSHDFSLFLAIPGCKTGKHTTEKPITKVVSTNTQKAIPTPVQNKRTDDTAACSRCRQGFFCSDHGSKPGISKPAAPAATKDESSTIAPAPIKKIVDINEPQICRNKGCGKTFKEKDNHDNACEYHPGPPVFHDRMRGWKCCDVHVKEFDEFMNIPPCAKGWHNANV